MFVEVFGEQIYDLYQFFFVQLWEYDDVVDMVEEFGFEVLFQFFVDFVFYLFVVCGVVVFDLEVYWVVCDVVCIEVGGYDDDCVFEVYDLILIVGEMIFFEDLQQ